MKFCDFIVLDAILEDIQGADKHAVLQTMLEALVKAGGIPKSELDDALKALMKRESLGSTAIGRGIAVPHTKYGTGDQPIGVLARSREGVDFASIDGEPVYIFFLVLSPENSPAMHLRALEYILLRMRQDNFVRFLKNARGKAELIELLKEADEYD